MRSQSLSGRFSHIVAVLIKYGFSDIVDHLEIPGRRRLNRAIGHDPKMTTWERVRLAMEELGPTFIKCGQILSQRADLVPRELIRELRKLQDDVAPEKYTDIRQVLEDSFETPLTEIFTEIDEIPIASASLAQVHRAKLVAGCREVAIKVQRPGIEETIKNDMDILERIAVKLDRKVAYFKVYNLPQLVGRIRQLIMQELDFIVEMHNMQVARSQLQSMEGIVIPEVYPEFCRKRVLTMGFFNSRKMKDVKVSELVDRKALARRGVNFSLQQVLEYGFFHADPHPGNILLDVNENMIVIDWGMVGWLTPRIRYELIDLLSALVINDVDEISEFLLNFTSGREDVDRLLLQNEIMGVTTRFIGLPLKEINLGQLLMDLTAILRSHGRILGTDLSIMIKALITAEETAKMIDPDLDVIEEIEPIVNRLNKKRFKPDNLFKGLYKSLRLMVRYQQEIPRHVVNIISKLDHEKLAIRFQHENLEEMQATLEKIVNRLVLGIITGSLFLGSSMIILAGTGPLIWGYSALGMIGYSIALVICLRLAMLRIRSK
jgi:ubiquinone biosynthesis protein